MPAREHLVAIDYSRAALTVAITAVRPPMLLADDLSTVKALRRLLRVARLDERPIVLWVGAGVSRWAGYPLWPELAAIFHSAYLRSVNDYDVERAMDLQRAQKYPEFFSLCRRSDRDLYVRLLTEHLGCPQPESSVHRRFRRLVAELHPIHILTTNVDESLEHGLTHIQVLQRSDLERAPNLLRRGASALCKLHGTISAAETIVLTKEDYDALSGDAAYLALLQLVFNETSVLFIGYGLADQYVLAALKESDRTMRLLGTGPHFVMASERGLAIDLPAAIQRISYVAVPHRDHRSTLQVLDMLRSALSSAGKAPFTSVSGSSTTPMPAPEPPSLPAASRSAYYIADLYPPGTWTTSQELEVTGSDGSVRNVLVGQGFVDGEVGKEPSRTLHDLAVGLLCFDEIYLPLTAMSRVHDLLGSARFWQVHETGALRFIFLPVTPAIVFPHSGAPAGGDLGLITRFFEGDERSWTAEEVIEAELQAAPGKEKEAEAHFRSLKASTVTLDQDVEGLPMTTRAVLLHPRLQSLIGLSDAVRPTSLPRWLAFPSLRLLHVVQAADACRNLGIPALKIPFGGERLMAAVVGAAESAYSATEVAGYLVLQRATGDLGTALQADPSLFDAIVKFRCATIGGELRREVFAALDVPDGTDFEAALNGGLRQAVPADVVDRARDYLEQLMVPQGMPVRPSRPAVWCDVAYSDNALRAWRRRSRQLFEAYCEENHLGPYDECPCGSQEKVRFCCELALKE